MSKFFGAVVHFYVECWQQIVHGPWLVAGVFAAVAGLAVLVWRMGR